MRQFGCEEYCIDDVNLTPEILRSTFDAILSNVYSVGSLLYDRAKKMSNVVKEDMQNLLNVKEK